MNALTLINARTIELSHSHSQLITVYRGIYATLLLNRNPLSTKSKAAFNSALAEASVMSLSAYDNSVSLAINDVIDKAISDNLTESEMFRLSDKIQGIKQMVSDTMVKSARLMYHTNLTKDIKYAKAKVGKLNFDVATGGANVKEALSSAILRSTMDGNFSTPNSNKEWITARNVRLSSRHVLMSAFNEAVVLMTDSLGDELFVVIGGRQDGLVVDLDGYNKIRKTAFHPNSDSLIARHKSKELFK